MSVGTAQAVAHEMNTSDGNDYVSAILERLQERNPHLLEFIAGFALQAEDQVAVTYGAALVYRLLESQLEADGLREELGEG